jgi:peroxidase
MTATPPSDIPPYRSLDGSDNAGRDEGKAGRGLLNLGLERPGDHSGDHLNPRRISTLVSGNGHSALDPYGRSEFMWAWGQFLDHELDHIRDRPDEPENRADIEIPADDPRLEFRGTAIPFTRSLPGLPNSHSAYVDASNVYSVCTRRLKRLRAGDGGKLLTCDGLLPRGEAGKDCVEDADAEVGVSPEVRAAKRMLGDEMDTESAQPALPADCAPETSRFFLAGDDRANEHCVLISMHTLFVREHNWWCDTLAARHPEWDGDTLFQEARRRVGAEMQAITYNEFLPALLGKDALPAYEGFKPDVDPGISTLFATACYRFGHSMVRNEVVLAADGYSLRLADLFFTPEYVTRLGIERWLWRLPYRTAAAIDPHIVDGLREFLFRNRAGNGSLQMLDLAALNIQRGRDHGLPDFNTCRENDHFQLPRIHDWHDLTGDDVTAARLAKAYGAIDALDVWVGALAERPTEGRRVGALLHATLVDQFTRLRDGDAYWYQCDSHLTEDREDIHATRLSDVLRRHTGELDGMPYVIPTDVFHV